NPAWPVNGRSLCAAPGLQTSPAIVADGTGGAIVAWQDARASLYPGIYAQHVLANGSVDPSWLGNGRALCTAGGYGQWDPAIVTDGAGGAIVAWMDIRGGDPHIYAQHIRVSGVIDPGWPTNGAPVCT